MRKSLIPGILILGACAGLAAVFGSKANAATVTDTFTSQIIIQASCIINSTNTLDFGTVGTLTANVDAQADISVQCSNLTAYNVRLDAGIGAGTIATRTMENAGTPVNYNMYRDAARTLNWGETDTVDTVDATGTGSAVLHTVYGRVPPQATPAANTYTDTVTVTVNF
ncbi:MAG: spore coat U domain-containing protein [Hyphomicrobiales bacterium]|nr:spore coat U domain-containing protein [Hyphomicrobiales bacterium]